MTFPPSSAEEIEAARQRGKVYDAKIAAAKLELERRKAQALPIPLPQIIPERARKWIRRRLRPFQQNPASAEAIEEAQVEYQWAIYDRSNLKRPLYPRKRAISPSNQAFRRDMQKHNSQKQSDFFKLLPPEIRAEVYRKVFGQLVVEIEAHHPTFRGGPPPSDDHVTFWMSKINDAASGGEWGSALHVSCHNAAPLQYIPHIVPLLQTCRQMYETSNMNVHLTSDHSALDMRKQSLSCTQKASSRIMDTTTRFVGRSIFSMKDCR